MKHLIATLFATIIALGTSLAQDASFQNVDAAKAKTIVADKKKAVTVLDVRTPAEFAEGHIADAKLIDFNASDFETKLAALDKSKPYLLHCRSGGRSSAAMKTMKKLGFKAVYHLDGGMLAWKKAGGAVKK